MADFGGPGDIFGGCRYCGDARDFSSGIYGAGAIMGAREYD